MFDPTTLIAVVILLGVVILVHEWGHFIAAKSFGVRVNVFSIGFGKRLWGWKRGDTDYRLSALPLGGYVKMAGDNPMEDRAGAPDEFLSKPRWQRAIIAVAGPVMNVVLAVVLLIAVFALVGIPVPQYFQSQVEIVGFAKDSPARASGLVAGDRVVEIAGIQNPTWEQALNALTRQAGSTAPVRVERGGEVIALPLTVPEAGRAASALGYAPRAAVVEDVGSGSPASKGGLRSGDHIVSVDGAPIRVWEEFTEKVLGSEGRPLSLVVDRNGEKVSLEVQPAPTYTESGTIYRVGVSNRIDVFYRPVAFSQAVTESVETTWFVCRQVVQVVGGLLRGRVSIRELGGVVEIAAQSGRAAREGWLTFVNLMVLISLNLAILNLLPIPILDGGHLLMLAIEGIRRRDLSLRVKERFVQVGFIFLMVIFAVVMYNDILKRLPKFLP
ncbi:MAG: RIP metalloprotease RseP [Candidatus Acidiferrales bacterium]